MLNGQTLGTADFEPAVRQQLEQVEDKIAAAKREILDLQINTILLQVEANRRRIDTHRLYETEVTKRIPVPTAAQIKNCSTSKAHNWKAQILRLRINKPLRTSKPNQSRNSPTIW